MQSEAVLAPTTPEYVPGLQYEQEDCSSWSVNCPGTQLWQASACRYRPAAHEHVPVDAMHMAPVVAGSHMLLPHMQGCALTPLLVVCVQGVLTQEESGVAAHELLGAKQ